jgi:thiamine biosynthesis lipoprotein
MAPETPCVRHAEQAMGTVFSFDIRHSDCPDLQAALAQAIAWLHFVDEVFSTYRPDSQISRLGRAELAAAECLAEVGEVLRRCREAERASGGWFTTMPGGRLDPSALVKGWAVERASRMLSDAGLYHHSINGGGDVRLSGGAAPGRRWRTGIADPLTPGRLAAVVTGFDLAVATSGVAERGHHIVDPHTAKPATALASVTLVGRDLGATDAWATAAFAMGDRAREWVEGLEGIEAFAVEPSGRTWWTSGFPAHLAPKAL